MKILIIISAFFVAGNIAKTSDLSFERNNFVNSTNEEVLSRNKRFLVFYPNGGIIKYVMGVLIPLDLTQMRLINCMRNLQYQYELPSSWITNPPSFPGLTRSEGRAQSGGEEIQVKADSTRKIAYEVVENMLDREGKNGRECLLRAICEVAETPVNHNGLVGELLQLFFTPGKHEKIHQDYRDARKVGLNRVSCEKMYSDCPFGHGILDSFSLIENFKFEKWLNF